MDSVLIFLDNFHSVLLTAPYATGPHYNNCLSVLKEMYN